MNPTKYCFALSAKRLTSRAIEKSNFRSLSTKLDLNTTTNDRNGFGKKNESNRYIQGSKTHFGFESVGIDEKEDRVKEVFENVADSYDIMNDFLSGGLHRFWKDRFVDASAVASMAQAIRQKQLDALASTGGSGKQNNTLQILDVAGGTGDISFRFLESAGYPERTQSSCEDFFSVTVCDINTEMLRVGKERAKKKYGSSFVTESKTLSFVEGNAQDLKNFENDSFDLYTIAFGLRNVTDVVSMKIHPRVP